MNLQPTIDALNEEIARLTEARDTLVATQNLLMPIAGRVQKKPTLSAKGRANIAAAQRARWAEQKRRQRNAAKKGTK